jgi:hypothetical protein
MLASIISIKQILLRHNRVGKGFSGARASFQTGILKKIRIELK